MSQTWGSGSGMDYPPAHPPSPARRLNVLFDPRIVLLVVMILGPVVAVAAVLVLLWLIPTGQSRGRDVRRLLGPAVGCLIAVWAVGLQRQQFLLESYLLSEIRLGLSLT